MFSPIAYRMCSLTLEGGYVVLTGSDDGTLTLTALPCARGGGGGGGKGRALACGDTLRGHGVSVTARFLKRHRTVTL